jgi:aminoglycoside phosphotransferase (APT) family kinase protein
MPKALRRTVVSNEVADDLPPGWEDGLDRMARAIGSRESPSHVRRLIGGLEGDTFAFRLADDRFVTKVYTGATSANQADIEFDNLAVASLATVPTPEPLKIDRNGEWFNAPAIVMTALPGRPDMHPSDRQRWIDGAAGALAAIHELPTTRVNHVQSPRWRRRRPPTQGLGGDSSRADALLARLYGEAGQLPTVVSHDDYNPGNLLFDNGHLSGVVDWADITVEPRQGSVALFRHFLAIHPGGGAPEMFLGSYQQFAKTSVDDLPLWDILYGLRGVRPVLDHWVLAFQGLGLSVTSEEIHERSRRWVREAILRAVG